MGNLVVFHLEARRSWFILITAIKSAVGLLHGRAAPGDGWAKVTPPARILGGNQCLMGSYGVLT